MCILINHTNGYICQHTKDKWYGVHTPDIMYTRKNETKIHNNSATIDYTSGYPDMSLQTTRKITCNI